MRLFLVIVAEATVFFCASTFSQANKLLTATTLMHATLLHATMLHAFILIEQSLVKQTLLPLRLQLT